MQLESTRGTLFPKVARALLIAKGDVIAAAAFAQGRGAAWSDAVDELKGIVQAVSTGTAPALVTPTGRDLSAYVREKTLLGKLPGLRRVPFSTKMLSTAAGTSGSWVGEGRAIPVGKLDFDDAGALDPTKISTICVITSELARSSQPAVEVALAHEIGAAVSSALDLAFIAADSVAIEGVRPASITSAATTFMSTGSTASDIDSDLRKAIGVLTDANIDLTNAAWIMPSRTATYLATLRDSSGSLAYPLATCKGGFLAGLPIATSAAAMDVSSPTEATIVLVAADQVDLADDGGASLSFSDSASLQLSDAPADASTTESVASLWQSNLSAIRAVRVVKWRLRHSSAVAVISGVQF